MVAITSKASKRSNKLGLIYKLAKILVAFLLLINKLENSNFFLQSLHR
jgi:hypothetical protein